MIYKLISYSPAPFPLVKTPSASFICANSVESSSAISYIIIFSKGKGAGE